MKPSSIKVQYVKKYKHFSNLYYVTVIYFCKIKKKYAKDTGNIFQNQVYFKESDIWLLHSELVCENIVFLKINISINISIKI